MKKPIAAELAAAFSVLALSGCGEPANEITPVTEAMSEASPGTAASLSDTTAESSTSETETTAVPEAASVTEAPATEEEPFTIAVSARPRETEPTAEVSTAASTSAISSASTAALSVNTVSSETSAASQTQPTERKTVEYMTYEEYFSRSLFVGDSICSGLKLHRGLLSPEIVAARGNVGTWSIDDYKFQYKNNSMDELDVYSIVKLKQPEDIFIWMGMNDLFMVKTPEGFADNMKKLAAAFHELSPESRIHIVSISPINAKHKWATNSDGNNRINKYNTAAREMCEDVDYLDWVNIHDCLTDKTGTLAPINDSGDGMHFSPEAYRMVLDEIVSYMETEVYPLVYADEEETTAAVTEPPVSEAQEDITEKTTVTVPEKPEEEQTETSPKKPAEAQTETSKKKPKETEATTKKPKETHTETEEELPTEAAETAPPETETETTAPPTEERFSGSISYDLDIYDDDLTEIIWLE